VTRSKDDLPYIYESPDGGKTVTRRKFGEMNKQTRTARGEWYGIEEIETLLSVLEEEVRLRQKYPAVQAAWDNYQLMIDLAKHDEGEVDE
jgi:hypothetical protein